jgi:hypothetical protein
MSCLDPNCCVQKQSIVLYRWKKLLPKSRAFILRQLQRTSSEETISFAGGILWRILAARGPRSLEPINRRRNLPSFNQRLRSIGSHSQLKLLARACRLSEGCRR